MKSYLFLLVLILVFPQEGDKYRLVVNVSGLKPLKGDLYISLHNRPEYFQVADSAFMKKKIAVDKETETVIFKDVPQGKYAIALYHDENQDGTMAVNEMGIPKEGYGFSTKNRAPGRPKFEQAAFNVNGNDTVEIRMIYHTAPETKKD
jgi:uncharacterized protein (DUF2141 family)